jgi:hypothetical protein
VLFFLLIAGDTFLRRLVEILPRFSDKRQPIEISQRIEEDISAYLIPISVMNAAVDLRRHSSCGSAGWEIRYYGARSPSCSTIYGFSPQ